MPVSKNSPPRNMANMAASLRIMAQYIDSTPDWPAELPSGAQILALAKEIETSSAAIASLQGKLSAEYDAQRNRMKAGSDCYRTVRDAIYFRDGKHSEKLLKAGLKICDVKPTDAAQPPRAPAIKSIEEISPTAVRIRLETVPHAKDYKYFMGTTPDTASMTLCDASNKTTFVYDNLKEGSKYYFAAKARNTAGESEFSAVANRWMY